MYARDDHGTNKQRTHVLDRLTAIPLGIFLGVLFWVLDAAVDSLVFHNGSFLEQLCIHVAPHDLFMRTVVLAMFIVLGSLWATLSARNRRTREELQIMTRAALDAIIVIGGQGTIASWNAAAASMFGYSAEEAIGENLHQLLAPQRYHLAFREGFTRFQKSGRGDAIDQTIELVGLRKNGEEFPLSLSLSAMRMRGEWRAVGIVRDITYRKQAEENLRESEKRFRTLFEASPLPINMADSEGRLALANIAFQELLGYSATELSGMTFLDIIHPEDKKADSEAFQSALAEHHSEYRIQQRYVHKSGKSIPVDVAVSVVLSPSGGFQYGFAIARDLTQQQEYEEKLVILARHDPLTGLYNRLGLEKIIEQEVRRSRRYKHPIGLLMVDVNRFKEVNDRFGHAMGDQVLKAVAEILQRSVRGSDVVVRFGGDEFLVVLIETDGETDPVVRRIRAEVAERNRANPLLEFPVTLAIGAGHWSPDASGTFESVLAQIDARMYENKAGQTSQN